jgi:hypothetical protein
VGVGQHQAHIGQILLAYQGYTPQLALTVAGFVLK